MKKMLVLGSMAKLLISFVFVLMLVTSFHEIVGQQRISGVIAGGTQPRPKGIIFRQVPVYRSKEDSINISKVEKLFTDEYNKKKPNQKFADSLLAVLGSV